jgi:sister-chromatid-cohesion protein PDS5
MLLSENSDSAAIRQFSWIPNEILHMMTVGSEVKSVPLMILFSVLMKRRLEVERVYGDYILPLPSSPTSLSAKGNDVDEVAWIDRLLTVMRYLDDTAVKSFLSLSGLKIK